MDDETTQQPQGGGAGSPDEVGGGGPRGAPRSENVPPQNDPDNRTGKDRRLANLKPWQPGQSGNPGGRPKRGNLLTRMAERLAAPSEILEAMRVIEDAGSDLDVWTPERLSNGDLIIEAMLGIALNRNGRVPYNVQLAAQAQFLDRMHGKVTDKTVGLLDADDESKRPLMTVEEFRRAITMKVETVGDGAGPQPASDEGGAVVVDVTATPVTNDEKGGARE
jgi:hypothetical protein